MDVKLTSRMSATNRLTHMTEEVSHQHTKQILAHLEKLQLLQLYNYDDCNYHYNHHHHHHHCHVFLLLSGVSAVCIHEGLPVVNYHDIIQQNDGSLREGGLSYFLRRSQQRSQKTFIVILKTGKNMTVSIPKYLFIWFLYEGRYNTPLVTKI